jgi:hypothetical protein
LNGFADANAANCAEWHDNSNRNGPDFFVKAARDATRSWPERRFPRNPGSLNEVLSLDTERFAAFASAKPSSFCVGEAVKRLLFRRCRSDSL